MTADALRVADIHCDPVLSDWDLYDLTPRYDILEGLRNAAWMGGVAVKLAWIDDERVSVHPSLMPRITRALEGRNCRFAFRNGEDGR